MRRRAVVDAVETFTYAVDDGYLGTASSTITIDLSNANAAPEITGRAGWGAGYPARRGQDDGGQPCLQRPGPDNADQGRHDLR